MSKPNVKLIQNKGNFNYPYCQNIGIEHAKNDILCFFNNDILVTQNWDKYILQALDEDSRLQILSVSTNDHLESKSRLKTLSRKWKRIKYPIQMVFGNSKFSLKLMCKLMYGNLNHFADKRYKTFGLKRIEGYSGSAIIAKKRLMYDIGKWDEQIQSADFDLFNKVKKNSLVNNNICPIQMVLGVYFHHFQRLTVKTKYPPFVNRHTMINLVEKWGNETSELRKDIVG